MHAIERPRLILASSSPQRAALLAQAGYSFEVIAPSGQAECGVCSRESPGEMVMRLARQKGADVVTRLRDRAIQADFVVACDTVAECQGQMLGKPADARHAAEMLRLLSGREHRVYSGLCLWPLHSGQPTVRLARTTLQMERLSNAEIEEYLASGLWQGKAGAFGYQDRLGWLRIIEGSETNVIGLPMELLGEMLAEAAG
jgi:septum formation protein